MFMHVGVRELRPGMREHYMDSVAVLYSLSMPEMDCDLSIFSCVYKESRQPRHAWEEVSGLELVKCGDLTEGW